MGGAAAAAAAAEGARVTLPVKGGVTDPGDAEVFRTQKIKQKKKSTFND